MQPWHSGWARRLCKDVGKAEDYAAMYLQVPEASVLWTWGHWCSCGRMPAASLAAR